MSSRPNSNAPWFCHECHSEMQAEMHPNPICSVCHSDFVEQLDPTSNNDPRQFDHDPVEGPGFVFPGGFEDDAIQPPFHDHDRDAAHPYPHVHVHEHDHGAGNGNIPGLLSMLLGRMALGEDGQTGAARRNDAQDMFGSRGTVGGNGAGRELLFRLGPGTMRVSTGTGRSGPGELLFPLPPSSPIRSRSPSSGAPGAPHGLGLPDTFQQYILALLNGVDSPLLAGGGSGRMGDYVFTQEALDALMTQMMEAGPGAGRARPASRETVQGLPRSTVKAGSDMLNRDCAVCKDGFEVGQEMVVLPCSHSFHNDCILPWLEINGTCPVCRTAVSSSTSSSSDADPPPPSSRSPRPPSSPSSPSSSARGGPTSPSSPSNSRQPNSPNGWSPSQLNSRGGPPPLPRWMDSVPPRPGSRRSDGRRNSSPYNPPPRDYYS